MIPKIIHYVWVGGAPLPEHLSHYIDTWKEKHPDYQVIEWNETNFDVFQHPYSAEAYRERKFAYVSDFIRFNVLYEMGGIYIDTDMECFRSVDDLLENDCVLGFEGLHYLGAVIMLFKPKHPLMQEVLRYYDGRKFVHKRERDGTVFYDTLTASHAITFSFLKHTGERKIWNCTKIYEDVLVLERDCLTPVLKNLPELLAEGKPYSAHHFEGSWKDKIKLTKLQYFYIRCCFSIAFRIVKQFGTKALLRKEAAIYYRANRFTKRNSKSGKKTTEYSI